VLLELFLQRVIVRAEAILNAADGAIAAAGDRAAVLLRVCCWICRSCGLRKNFGSAGFWAAPLPFVIFAEPALMLFYLGFDFAEGFFADGSEVHVAGRGVERAGRKREVQSECVFFGAGDFGKYGVEQNKIGLIGFQKRVQFGYSSFKLLVDWVVTLDLFETYGEFHMRTCRICEG
jgi:hypothetical protein